MKDIGAGACVQRTTAKAPSSAIPGGHRNVGLGDGALVARGGAHSTDIVHIAYGYGLFTGGLGAHYGAEALGATVIPSGGGMTERQVRPHLTISNPTSSCARRPICW